jgi:ABC-2 type transport system ATP-binding protein
LDYNVTIVIELEGVNKAFRGNQLFESLEWQVEEGRAHGLVGVNGSGKSVLLKMICGFVRPDAGSVHVDPRFLAPGRTYPDKFGVIIDGPSFQAGLSAFDNLMALARIRQRYGADHVTSMLELVGLDPGSRKRARSFSLGMKQKLALAQAFMEEPDVLLLDEPFNGLDEASVANIKEYLRRLKAVGKTIVFTSHNRADIEELSDSVWAIRDGGIRRA